MSGNDLNAVILAMGFVFAAGVLIGWGAKKK